MSKERIDINVKMSVTPAQAIALRAFFKCWNSLASMGASRKVSFFVDGDGNFKPNCEVTFLGEHEHLNVPEDRLEWIENHARAPGKVEQSKDLSFDFDSVAWALRAYRENSFLLTFNELREMAKKPDLEIKEGYYLGYCLGNEVHITGNFHFELPFVVRNEKGEVTDEKVPVWCRAVVDGEHNWINFQLQKQYEDTGVHFPYDWEMKKEIDTKLFLDKTHHLNQIRS